MRIITKHTFFSILKIGFITALIASVLLMGVDLFKNIDSYINYSFGYLIVLKLTILYFPEALLLGLGPSFLFAVTYYLSSLQSNNELITLYNSGLSYKKIIIPCIFLAFIVSLFYFIFNEKVAISSSNKKAKMFEQLSYSTYGQLDNTNIYFNDSDNGYIIFADQYVDSNETLYSVTLIQFTKDQTINKRVDSYKATWNSETKTWELFDNTIIEVSVDSKILKKYNQDDLKTEINIEPTFFKNASLSISNLPLDQYYEYLQKIKRINPEKYASVGTEFYSRVLSCLTPLVLMIISCFSNVRFKKNVLFFSIIVSLCFGVVYYVIRIVTIMLSGQGIIEPYWGTLIPFISVIIISIIISIFMRR